MKFLSKLVLPKRKSSSKKGDSGRVLIIGGSKEYIGAVALAGLAALRSGVDWVTIAAPEKVGWAVNALSPDLVVKKLKGNYFSVSHAKELLKMEKRYNTVLIGNGISLKAASFVKKFVKNSKKPLVIDADALKVISLTDVNNSILTPHKKEMEILLKNTRMDLKKAIRKNVIVKKGKIDEIITRNKTYYNKTGNAGMTKAGTGDVLAGLAAGFYAQTKDNIQAAKLAAYYNGLIGDILLKKHKGYSYLASDMVTEIKSVRLRTK
ncbi:NAD(P)H-hydrate dehydratase [Candidatus Woesearchaeota archaeon]|nr:NAD(P)H-hydrate dehydratase [Candidatus Woesearchaeota archaeon]